ncbi:TetR/AcrR family transcriptional regulator [Pseudomonas sp. NPDC087342]|uniref:TetR/AcrR family transcriptional regulator n=1 Tax=Pseudomonas sp. NPDC087342 TaxID=3364437 RepID=UPI00380AFB0A
MIPETVTAHTFAPISAEASTCRLLDNWDKGLQLLAAKGFAQVSIRVLAACMGVSPGALYHHYPSKQHLLFGIVEEFYEELLAALKRVDPRTKEPVSAVILAHLDVYEDHRWHCCIAVCDCNCLTPDQLCDLARLKGRYQQRLGTF